MCLDTSWKAIGTPFVVNPEVSVMVGLPLMLKGAVNRVNASNARGSCPSVAICAVVGDGMNCDGMISRSMDWNSAANRPLKSRRRSRIFW